MKNKAKMTAVAGVAICSFVSVVDAGQVTPHQQLSAENMTVLKSEAPHPYTDLIDSGTRSSVAKHQVTLGKQADSKRQKHWGGRSLWQRIKDLFDTPESSQSDIKLLGK